MERKSRKSYSLKFKLDVLNSYQPNVKGFGFLALSKKYYLDESIIRKWYNQKDKLIQACQDQKLQISKSRRIGGGLSERFPQLEKKLFEWIIEQHKYGLRIIDKYIEAKAKNIRDQMIAEDETMSYDDKKLFQEFKASSGWIIRFKTRHNLVSRRVTSSKVIPENVEELCINFIRSVHDLIDIHKIQLKNIINFDQVPRYFEANSNRTIAIKGSRNIFLKKGTSGHKRFTFTYAIQGDGKILKPHILFSKLVNRPVLTDKVIVDVNNTGMWNEEILKNFMNLTILNRPESTFYKEPTLILLDSYGTHIKYVRENYDKIVRRNIFLMLIPKNLTGLLQPEDVVLNHSFQAFYNRKYDEYLQNGLNDPQFKTKTGQIKTPIYKTVANWVIEWIESKSKEEVRGAFQAVGLVPRYLFDVEKLHQPLNEFYKKEFNTVNWLTKWQEKIPICEDCFENHFDSDFYYPEHETTSFMLCIKKILNKEENFDLWIEAYSERLLESLNSIESSVFILDDDHIKKIKSGISNSSRLEILGVSRMERWKINVLDIDENGMMLNSSAYDVEEPLKEITIVCLDDYFALKL